MIYVYVYHATSKVSIDNNVSNTRVIHVTLSSNIDSLGLYIHIRFRIQRLYGRTRRLGIENLRRS